MSARDPLAAIPVIPLGVRAEPLAEGREGLLLCREIAPRGPIGRWLRSRLGWKRERSVELDGLGARFWSLADGRRSLAEIELQLRPVLARSQPEARRALVEFTASLVRRGWLALRLPGGTADAVSP